METTVYIYRNLRKRCYSIMHKGRVIGYATSLFLRDVEFVVRPAGQKKVRETKQKNVHAFVKGRIVEDDPARVEGWRQLGLIVNGLDQKGVMYNPYKFDTFVDTLYHKPIHKAESALLMDDFRMVAYNVTAAAA
jgi:hypothetical protein